jgi:phosphoheptose isomerase
MAYSILEESYSSGRKLLVCGNGGSASDSEHIVGELMKEFKLKRNKVVLYGKPEDEFTFQESKFPL